jgi:catechol 2,3-dioxygenase-like lactoylglutathione lyase family enzyme
MNITGLNHLTLSVSDLDRATAFYSGLLGFSVRMRGPSSVYLEAGTLWLALVLDSQVRQGSLPEYSHVAFSVSLSDLPVLVNKLRSAGVTRWREPEDSASFYFSDPDGHKLELHSGDLNSRLKDRARDSSSNVVIYGSSKMPAAERAATNCRPAG